MIEPFQWWLPILPVHIRALQSFTHFKTLAEWTVLAVIMQTTRLTGHIEFASVVWGFLSKLMKLRIQKSTSRLWSTMQVTPAQHSNDPKHTADAIKTLPNRKTRNGKAVYIQREAWDYPSRSPGSYSRWLLKEIYLRWFRLRWRIKVVIEYFKAVRNAETSCMFSHVSLNHCNYFRFFYQNVKKRGMTEDFSTSLKP